MIKAQQANDEFFWQFWCQPNFQIVTLSLYLQTPSWQGRLRCTRRTRSNDWRNDNVHLSPRSCKVQKTLRIMAIRVVEFSNGGYKIRKVFYSMEIIEFWEFTYWGPQKFSKIKVLKVNYFHLLRKNTQNWNHGSNFVFY